MSKSLRGLCFETRHPRAAEAWTVVGCFCGDGPGDSEDGCRSGLWGADVADPQCISWGPKMCCKFLNEEENIQRATFQEDWSVSKSGLGFCSLTYWFSNWAAHGSHLGSFQKQK